jgi:hypothetical protein
MSLNNQPVRGIIPVLCVIISSIIFIGIGQGTFGINPDILSVYALFFVWTPFIVSFAGNWPLENKTTSEGDYLFGDLPSDRIAASIGNFMAWIWI